MGMLRDQAAHKGNDRIIGGLRAKDHLVSRIVLMEGGAQGVRVKRVQPADGAQQGDKGLTDHAALGRGPVQAQQIKGYRPQMQDQ